MSPDEFMPRTPTPDVAILDENGRVTPEGKATILGEVVRQAAMTPGPITEGAIFESVRVFTKCAEEEVSHEIRTAIFLAVHGNLFTSNRHDAATAAFVHSADTTINASRLLTSFIWDNPESDQDEAA